MDVIKTRNYYRSLQPEDVCQCRDCQNYVKNIKISYPLVSNYLQNIGVDIEKPFETSPSGPAPDGVIYYFGTQYIVLGSKDDFKKAKISDVCIYIAESHPVTDVIEEHFVIETDILHLKWNL